MLARSPMLRPIGMTTKSVPVTQEQVEAAQETLQDFEETLSSFEQAVQEFQASNKNREKAQLSLAEVKLLESESEDFQGKLTEFNTAMKERIALHAGEFQSAGLPMEVRRGWLEAVSRSTRARQQAHEAQEKGRVTRENATQLVKKEMLRVARSQMGPDAGKEAVQGAQQLVQACEEKAEPFVGIPQNKEEGEMEWIAKEIESMVGTAREGIAGAREQLAGERIESVEVEEDIKEDFQAFLQEEAKRSEMCLGQLERRLGRVQNLVANYQRDIQRERNKQTIEELKPQILEQAQALDFAAAEAEVSKAIKAAEEASSPSKKLELMTVEELQAAMEQMTQKVADAESSLKSLEEQICPVEDQDELVKKALQKYVLSQMKSVGSKLSFLQQRLARPKEALEKCRQLIRKKESFRIKSLQVKAMKLMDIFREDQAGKGLEGLPSTDIFRAMDGDGDGLISKEEFIQFFLDLEPLLEDKQQHLKASLEDLERLFSFGLGKEQGLTLQGMEKLVIRFMKVVRPTPLTKNLQVVPGETLRELQLGELLEVLGGPQQSSQKLPRVMCRAKGQVGWATISGNVGTVFLRDFQPE